MKNLDVIIIEDEPLARAKLESFVKKMLQLRFVQSFSDAADAVGFVNNRCDALILLDINMPGMSGIEFIETIKTRHYIIFTTAYDEYAIKGFELGVSDYLLKPFTFDRFSKAVEKVLAIHNLKNSGSEPEFIMIKSEHRIEKIDTSDIIYIEGMKDYLRIHTPYKTIMTLKSMSMMLEELPMDKFLRVHKSYIVALDKINGLDKDSVFLQNETIPIGKSYKAELLTKFKSNF